MIRRIVSLLLLVVCMLGAIPPQHLNAAMYPDAASKRDVGFGNNSFYRGWIPFARSKYLAQGYAPSTNVSGSTQQQFIAPYAGHDFSAVYALYGNTGGGEFPAINPITIRASWKSGASTNAGIPMTFGGKRDITLNPYASGPVRTDTVIGSVITGDAIWIDTYFMLSQPPQTPAVSTVGSGGTLGAATYFYKLTTTAGEQGESGPSAEVSVATAANGVNTVTWTAPISNSVTPTAYNVYRSTATGTEKLLGTVLGAGTFTFVDTGSLTVSTTVSPPAAQFIPIGLQFEATPTNRGEGTNYISSGGAGTDFTTTASPTLAVSSYGYGAMELDMRPDTGANKAIGCFLGDSINWGQLDTTAWQLGYLSYAATQMAPQLAYHWAARPGEEQLYGTEGYSRYKYQFLTACTFAVDEYGTNEINLYHSSLATLQANSIASWRSMAKRVPAVYQTTLLPSVGTTDGTATTTYQAVGPADTITGITATNPAVISITAGSRATISDGDPIKIVTGSSAANVVAPTPAGTFYYAKVTGQAATDVALYSDQALTTGIPGTGTMTTTPKPLASLEKQALNVRIGFNVYLRCGAPMNLSFAPLACGTAGALLAGMPGHPLAGVIDAARSIEVNAAGVLTQDGGYWIAGGSTEGVHPGAGAATIGADVATQFQALGLNSAPAN